MDEGEGLRLKMEVYKASGSHTMVLGLPWGLDMAPEGPQGKKRNYFILLYFARKCEKLSEWHPTIQALIYYIVSLHTVQITKPLINSPMSFWAKDGGLWPQKLRQKSLLRCLKGLYCRLVAILHGKLFYDRVCLFFFCVGVLKKCCLLFPHCKLWNMVKTLEWVPCRKTLNSKFRPQVKVDLDSYFCVLWFFCSYRVCALSTVALLRQHCFCVCFVHVLVCQFVMHS